MPKSKKTRVKSILTKNIKKELNENKYSIICEKCKYNIHTVDSSKTIKDISNPKEVLGSKFITKKLIFICPSCGTSYNFTNSISYEKEKPKLKF